MESFIHESPITYYARPIVLLGKHILVTNGVEVAQLFEAPPISSST